MSINDDEDTDDLNISIKIIDLTNCADYLSPKHGKYQDTLNKDITENTAPPVIIDGLFNEDDLETLSIVNLSRESSPVPVYVIDNMFDEDKIANYFSPSEEKKRRNKLLNIPKSDNLISQNKFSELSSETHDRRSSKSNDTIAKDNCSTINNDIIEIDIDKKDSLKNMKKKEIDRNYNIIEIDIDKKDSLKNMEKNTIDRNCLSLSEKNLNLSDNLVIFTDEREEILITDDYSNFRHKNNHKPPSTLCQISSPKQLSYDRPSKKRSNKEYKEINNCQKSNKIKEVYSNNYLPKKNLNLCDKQVILTEEDEEITGNDDQSNLSHKNKHKDHSPPILNYIEPSKESLKIDFNESHKGLLRDCLKNNEKKVHRNDFCLSKKDQSLYDNLVILTNENEIPIINDQINVSLKNTHTAHSIPCQGHNLSKPVSYDKPSKKNVQLQCNEFISNHSREMPLMLSEKHDLVSSKCHNLTESNYKAKNQDTKSLQAYTPNPNCRVSNQSRKLKSQKTRVYDKKSTLQTYSSSDMERDQILNKKEEEKKADFMTLSKIKKQKCIFPTKSRKQKPLPLLEDDEFPRKKLKSSKNNFRDVEKQVKFDLVSFKKVKDNFYPKLSNSMLLDYIKPSTSSDISKNTDYVMADTSSPPMLNLMKEEEQRTRHPFRNSYYITSQTKDSPEFYSKKKLKAKDPGHVNDSVVNFDSGSPGHVNDSVVNFDSGSHFASLIKTELKKEDNFEPRNSGTISHPNLSKSIDILDQIPTSKSIDTFDQIPTSKSIDILDQIPTSGDVSNCVNSNLQNMVGSKISSNITTRFTHTKCKINNNPMYFRIKNELSPPFLELNLKNLRDYLGIVKLSRKFLGLLELKINDVLERVTLLSSNVNNKEGLFHIVSDQNYLLILEASLALLTHLDKTNLSEIEGYYVNLSIYSLKFILKNFKKLRSLRHCLDTKKVTMNSNNPFLDKSFVTFKNCLCPQDDCLNDIYKNIELIRSRSSGHSQPSNKRESQYSLNSNLSKLTTNNKLENNCLQRLKRDTNPESNNDLNYSSISNNSAVILSKSLKHEDLEKLVDNYSLLDKVAQKEIINYLHWLQETEAEYASNLLVRLKRLYPT